MVKKQICFTADDDTYKRLERTRDETGIPISKQIELSLKGYEITKKESPENKNNSKNSTDKCITL